MLHEGDLFYAEYLRWAPNGRQVACVTWVDLAPRAISVFTPDGAPIREVYRESGTGYLASLQWYVEPLTGDTTIVFARDLGISRASYSIRPDGTGLKPFIRLVGTHDALSPDGRWIAGGALNRDTLGLLFISRVEDVAKLGARQLTFYEPPDP